MMSQRRRKAVEIEHNADARHLLPVLDRIGGGPDRQLFFRTEGDQAKRSQPPSVRPRLICQWMLQLAGQRAGQQNARPARSLDPWFLRHTSSALLA